MPWPHSWTAVSHVAVDLRGLRCGEMTSGPASIFAKYFAMCAKSHS